MKKTTFLSRDRRDSSGFLAHLFTVTIRRVLLFPGRVLILPTVFIFILINRRTWAPCIPPVLKLHPLLYNLPISLFTSLRYLLAVNMSQLLWSISGLSAFVEHLGYEYEKRNKKESYKVCSLEEFKLRLLQAMSWISIWYLHVSTN